MERTIHFEDGRALHLSENGWECDAPFLAELMQVGVELEGFMNPYGPEKGDPLDHDFQLAVNFLKSQQIDFKKVEYGRPNETSMMKVY